MRCERCSANPTRPIMNFEALDTDTDMHILCHKCYVHFNTIIADRDALGAIMRRHLPMKTQRKILSERRRDYAQSEVPICR